MFHKNIDTRYYFLKLYLKILNDIFTEVTAHKVIEQRFPNSYAKRSEFIRV